MFSDYDSFSSIGSLFHARGATTENALVKFDFLLCLGAHLPAWGGGALTPFLYKLRPKFFFSALGVHVHPLHPLTTPMESADFITQVLHGLQMKPQ